MAEDEVNLEEGGGKKKLIIIIAAVVLLLLVGGGVAAYFLMSGDDEETAEKGDQAKTEQVAEAEDAAADPALGGGPVVAYLNLKPAFVVNLVGKPRLLQVSLAVSMRDPALEAFLTQNDPMIRHRLLNLLGRQDGTKLKDKAAKEQLQADLLAELEAIIKDYQGPSLPAGLYFTDFKMQ